MNLLQLITAVCCGLQSRAVSVLTVPKVVLLGPRLSAVSIRRVSSSALDRLLPRNGKVLYSVLMSIVLATGFAPVTDALGTWKICTSVKQTLWSPTLDIRQGCAPIPPPVIAIHPAVLR